MDSVRNGKRVISVKTLHGEFTFAEQQFLSVDDEPTSFLKLTNQDSVSAGLEEYCLYWVTRTSDRNVVELVERNTGRRLVCAQTICNWVKRKAAEIDLRLVAEVKQAESLPLPPLAKTVDVYDPASEEVHIFCDGILVKAQKPTHEKAGEPRAAKVEKRHETDIILFQKPGGGFHYLAAATNGAASLPEVTSAFLRSHWQDRSTPLPILAITDGATKIRSDLAVVFGDDVTIILDWYHLSKKVYELMSMVAHSRGEREELERIVLGHLWNGETAEALNFLSTVQARNQIAHAKLVGYLDKHKSEIIDYGRRARTGKPIGSGRMEKAVDIVIGIRQKDNGMSWSKLGSQSLGHLRLSQLNDEWNDLWPDLDKAA